MKVLHTVDGFTILKAANVTFIAAYHGSIPLEYEEEPEAFNHEVINIIKTQHLWPMLRTVNWRRKK